MVTTVLFIIQIPIEFHMSIEGIQKFYQYKFIVIIVRLNFISKNVQ